MLLVNAHVLTMDTRSYEHGYVLVRDGKIAAVGEMNHAPQGYDGEVVDVQGGWVTPGLIDAHCHIGLFGDSLGFEGEDGNESARPVTPELRAVDAVNPLDGYFSDARAAGVTTVVTSPGSANVVGGQVAALKTNGTCVDDMLLSSALALKVAFGENPKKTHHQHQRSPMTRMATAALLRQAFLNARSYAQREDKHRVDLGMEALLAVLRGEMPLHAHAHRADDICTALRIAREFDVNVVIVHGTEGHLVKEQLLAANAPVLVGPILCDRAKPELSNLSLDLAHELSGAGIPVALMTDHPELPIGHLLLTAQLAAKHGMGQAQALRAITCDAASIVGLSEKVGKLSVGMDADLVIFDRNPMDFCANICAVYIDGKKTNK